jgi:hypothetical protein
MGGTRFGTGLIAGVLAGILAGWILGRCSQSGPRLASERPPDAPEEHVESAAPPASELAAPRSSGREGARKETRPEESTPTDAPLITEALREHARAGIARGWASERRDPIPAGKIEEGLVTFERDVLAAPEQIGKTLGVLANQADGAIQDFLAHDPIALLDRLDAGGIGPRPEFVTDAAGFAQLFPALGGKAADGVASLRDPDAVLEDGSFLVFPAGVFRIRSLMEKKDPFPRDVTVRGAGMNVTLLLVQDLSTRGELRNFAFKDCTVFTENDSLFDLRIRPASILFERVRVIGFDSGAGGSSLLDAPGMAVLARASRFEGGHGRSAGGKLFDVRSDALLARFERCQIDQVELELRLVRPGASVAFVSCTLTNILDRRPVEDQHPGVAFPGSTIEYFPADQGTPPRKDLNEIFPDWQQRIEQ